MFPERVPGSSSAARFAVLGHPIDHSLSPRMQNAAFAAAGLDASYEALDVPVERLAAALAETHAAEYVGLNLTLPLKEAALPLLEGMSEEAERAGAVNTLRRTARGWEGHATDGPGFLAWIRSAGRDPRGASAIVIGAGGAARSVVTALIGAGASSVHVANRTAERAERLVRDLERRVPATVSVTASGLRDVAPGVGKDLLVRAVSAKAVDPDEAAWWRSLAPEGWIFDLNYGQRSVAARREARRFGRRYEDGLEMLVEQGAISFEIWTGQEAPRAAMRAAVGVARGE